MKRKKCICHARENTGKREWIKVYEHPPLWKSDNNNNNKVLLWYLKTPEAISSTSVLYKNCMNTRYCKSWQKGLIINVVAIRRWKLAILSDLSTRGDYHSQIYTKAAIPTDASMSFMHLSCRAAFSCGYMDDSLFKRKAHSRFDYTCVLHKKNERKWMCIIR